jgi:hypothetical protein
MEIVDWLVAHRDLLIWVVLALTVLVIARRVFRRIRRWRHPPQIHPLLQKYAGRTPAEIEADRQAAQTILATSSTALLAGYEIARQIEAVYVEGLRSPAEAIQALKASAARLGANAIVNLAQQRNATGRCTAQGDAVVVRPVLPPAAPPPPTPPLGG